MTKFSSTVNKVVVKSFALYLLMQIFVNLCNAQDVESKPID